MILMIDNYDSFTFNLVQYLWELNEEVLVYRNDQITLEDIERMSPEQIIISPGPCTPNEAGISLNLINYFAGRIPILGVCLGHQSIGQVFGGKVVRAPRLMHGKTSEIFHLGKTIFNGLKNPLTVTRYHSLILEPNSLPKCFEVSAWTQQGEIMGVTHKDYLLEGVQFHPEAILTEQGHSLLQNFLDLSRERSASQFENSRSRKRSAVYNSTF